MSEGQKMSTDKLQATIAEILSEPPLISTNTEPSPPTFFDEEPAEQTPVDAPADAGNLAIRAEQAKSQKINRNRTQANIRHILSEPPLISTNNATPSRAFFDEEPAEQTPVDAPADAGNLAIRAEQAKSQK